MVSKPIFVALFFSLVLTACGEKDTQVKIGHGGGYLSAALYAAHGNFPVNMQQFRSSSDAAYLLLLGQLDAVFVEAEKLGALSRLEGFDRLTVVGKVTYPYGATLVLRKGLNKRLHELDGLTIAVSAPQCKLLTAFTEDAERLGADISGVRYKYMAFDAMVPALESGEVDAAIIRGTYSVVALQEGHFILYQNWDVQPGDECCPAIIDQAALALLAHRSKLDAIEPLLDALEKTRELSQDDLRRAVADNTVIPFEILQGQPVPEFSRADDELVEIFRQHSHDDDDHNHDHDDHYGNVCPLPPVLGYSGQAWQPPEV
ncbi:MAG: hypothetical protein FWH15_08690 [Betaproteobacteria bacterium]|nr:hypothetical protein [Betaproteobacteria bacterium]